MARVKKTALLEKLIDAGLEGGSKVLVLRDEHPFVLRLIDQDRALTVRVYIWNLTHGGGSRRPADEYRIQITGIDNERGFDPTGVDQVLILGWWDDAGIFAGFDFRHHQGTLGASPSIQIREDALRRAVVNGFTTHSKGSGEIAVAFRPAFLPKYAQELERIHGFGESERDRGVLERVIEKPEQVNNTQLATVTAERQVVVTSIAKALRDISFRDRVLTAYGHRCAFCEVQLKLVEAAHIVPVQHSGSDATENGLALCSLHHTAFDRALVTLNEQYQIVINTAQLRELQRLRLDAGVDRFRRDLRPIIVVPPERRDRPNVALIRVGNRLRGW